MKKVSRTLVASEALALVRAGATVSHPGFDPEPAPWQPSPQPWLPIVIITPIRQF
jgi:hypothetical protein